MDADEAGSHPRLPRWPGAIRSRQIKQSVKVQSYGKSLLALKENVGGSHRICICIDIDICLCVCVCVYVCLCIWCTTKAGSSQSILVFQSSRASTSRNWPMAHMHDNTLSPSRKRSCASDKSVPLSSLLTHHSSITHYLILREPATC